MKRYAFTICFNAIHHLLRNRYVSGLLPAFDRWVFVEGLAKPGGSTAWCNEVSSDWHQDGHSLDGTREWLQMMAANHHNLSVRTNMVPWPSKDAMVNEALDILRAGITEWPVLLWEIDADEHWESPDMEAAESAMVGAGCDRGDFLCRYWVGPNLRAVGEWGEGRRLPYRRLWLWFGERFLSHEPPQLDREDKVRLFDTIRFDHYAYTNENDVRFKDEYYGGHEGILGRWRALQDPAHPFPCHVRELLGEQCSWSRGDTQIVRTTPSTQYMS